MIINWLGQSCFKIKTKDLIIICDPFGAETGLKPVKSKADLVTISHQHPDHNYLKGMMGHLLPMSGSPTLPMSGSPTFIIDTPGEYEVQGIYVLGLPSFHDAKEGKERGNNIIYRYLIEGMVIVHLGDLGHLLNEEMVDQLGDVDILFLPVGGGPTLAIDKLTELVSQIEPRLVIPMHYKLPHLAYPLEPVDKFCEEMGISPKAQIDKIKIRKKDLENTETEVKILKQS